MDNYIPMLGVPGTDIVIYKDHEEIFRYQSGFDSITEGTPVRPDALYYMYSCTKVATCVAATQLIERGEILASDPVYAYLPEYADIKVRHVRPDGRVEIKSAKNVLKIEHLLTMTGGLDYNLQRPGILRTIERTGGKAPTLEIVKALAEDPFDFEPGTKYQYSLCLDVIGGLVELVSGMSLGDYFKENIFEPLGMDETSFDLTEDRLARLATQYQFNPETGEVSEIPKEQNPFVFGTEYHSGGAGLISTVEDFSVFAQTLASGGTAANGYKLIGEKGIELLKTPVFDALDLKNNFTCVQGTDYAYGMGVRVRTKALECGIPKGEFGWDGAAGSYILVDTDNGISITMGLNILNWPQVFAGENLAIAKLIYEEIV